MKRAPLQFIETGRIEHTDFSTEAGKWYLANRELWYDVPNEGLIEIPLGRYLYEARLALIPWSLRGAQKFLWRFKPEIQMRAIMWYTEIDDWQWHKLFVPEFQEYETLRYGRLEGIE